MKLSVLSGCVIVALSCSPLVCTESGCENGLSVTVPSAVATPFRVEAFVSRGGAVYAQTCSAAPCVVFFTEFTPAQVSVDVIAGGDTVTRAFTPAYARFRPNGTGCDPECRIATVTFVP